MAITLLMVGVGRRPIETEYLQDPYKSTTHRVNSTVLLLRKAVRIRECKFTQGDCNIGARTETMTKLRSKEVASAELDGSFHRSTTDDLKYPAATTDQKYGVHREEPHKEPLQSVHLALMCSERELSSRRVQASNLATTVSDLSTKVSTASAENLQLEFGGLVSALVSVSTTSAENLRLKGRNLELQQELSAAKREAAAALTRAASLQREVLSARGMAVDAQREAVQAQGEVEKARAEVGVAQRDAALAIVRARASEDSVEEAIRSIEQLKEQGDAVGELLRVKTNELKISGYNVT
eukprot:gene18430-24906_t